MAATREFTLSTYQEVYIFSFVITQKKTDEEHKGSWNITFQITFFYELGQWSREQLGQVKAVS